MTLDKLLKLTPDEWDRISDTELKAFLDPYFNITKPSLAPKPVHTTKKSGSASTGRRQANLSELEFLMKKAGIAVPPPK